MDNTGRKSEVIVNGRVTVSKKSFMKWFGKGKLILTVVAFAAIGGSIWSASAATTTETLWSSNTIPQTITASDTKSVELGVRFQSKIAGNVTGVKFYKGAQNIGTHTGTLWDANGKALASVVFTSETSNGWQTANFPKPVPVAANVTYTISYHAPNGHYSYTANYFTKAHINGDLTALPNSLTTTSTSSIGPIVGIANKCLDDKHAVFANQNTIWLFTCNSTDAQQWSFPGDGTIRIDQNKFCLDVQYAGTKSGTRVWLYGCNGTVAQQWVANNNGTIVNPHSGLCLDDKRSGKKDGNPIQVYTCNNTQAQQWHIPSTAPMASGSGNGVFADADSPAFPTSSLQATNYWVDVIFQSSTFGGVVAPAPPTSVSAAQSGTTVRVRWSASLSQNPIVQYKVFRNGSAFATVSGATLSYSDSAVTAGTTYSYQIEAVDSAGQVSALSPKATVTVAASSPAPVPIPTPVGTNSSSGSKYSPNDGQVYLGVSTDHNIATGGSDRLATFDQTLGIKQPAIFNIYSYYQLGATNTAADNGTFANQLTDASKNPYMTPEISWGLAFTNASSGQTSTAANLMVTNGSWDANIAARAAEIKAFGKPVFLRLDWEFNGSWYSNWNNPQVTPAQYIASWQYVVSKFKAAGVSNAIWVWCPNVNDYFDRNGTRFTTAEWYPGDAYVDWVGLDAYPQSNTQDTLLNGQDGMNQIAQFATTHNKAVILNEWALNTPHPDDPSVIDWVLAWQDANPKTVKANLWFDFITQGKDFTLVDHPNAATEFRAKIAASPGKYLTGPIQ